MAFDSVGYILSAARPILEVYDDLQRTAPQHVTSFLNRIGGSAERPVCWAR